MNRPSTQEIRGISSSLSGRFNYRSEKRPIIGPAALADSAINERLWYSKAAAVIRDCVFNPLKLYDMICSGVVCLNRFCRKTDVSGFIISGIVDSVDCEARHIKWANVFKKIGENKPRLVNRDAAPSVVFVTLGFWVRAAVNQISVKHVKLCLPSSWRMAVGRVSFYHPGHSFTSAGFYATVKKSRAMRDVWVSAFTNAVPVSAALLTLWVFVGLGYSEHCKNPELLSRDVLAAQEKPAHIFFSLHRNKTSLTISAI